MPVPVSYTHLLLTAFSVLSWISALRRKWQEHQYYKAMKDAFEMIWEEQKENGWTDAEIDGMTGLVFCNRYGNIMNAQSVTRAIKRISSAYNLSLIHI